MTDYSREELIALCEKSIVPERAWSNRDSKSTNGQVGACWAFLNAGCEFAIIRGAPGGLETNEDDIWVRVFPKGFNTFEYGREEGINADTETFYLPTEKRLLEANSRDWCA